MDPRPSFPDVLQLPSGLNLEVDFTYPQRVGVNGPKKLVVCSHPWSRLGGSMRDPYVHCHASVSISCSHRFCIRVLGSLVEPLSRLGYHVLVFNARGVGRSSGWASWTAFQEGKDLEELINHLMEILGNVEDVALIVSDECCSSTRVTIAYLVAGIFERLLIDLPSSGYRSAYTNNTYLHIISCRCQELVDSFQWPCIPEAAGGARARAKLPSSVCLRR